MKANYLQLCNNKGNKLLLLANHNKISHRVLGNKGEKEVFL